MKDLTQGPVAKHVVLMALPIAAGILLQTMYYLVDLYFIGELGEAAIAGVSAAGNATFLVIAITQILSVGAVALISQAVGRKERDYANLVFNQSLLVATIMAIVTLIAGYLWAELYMKTISKDPHTIQLGTTYLFWFIPNLALQFVLVAMGAALRGTGIVKPTIVVQLISMLINIFLSPILIAGWGTGYPMGVAGAGLASSIAAVIAVILMGYYFQRVENYIVFEQRLFKPDWDSWKKILSIGFPAGGEFLLMFFYMAVIYWAIRDFGAEAQAGFGLGSRIMQSIFVPALALAFALPSVVGQNFGALQYQRVRQAFTKTSLMISGIMLILTLVCLWEPRWLFEAFTDDAEVIVVAVGFIQLVSLNFIPSGLIFTCSGLFQGLGNAWPSFISMGSRLFLFAIPSIWISQQSYFRIEHIWYLSIATVVLQAAISLLLVKLEMNKKLALKLNPAST